jgi:hypothetical protein
MYYIIIIITNSIPVVIFSPSVAKRVKQFFFRICFLLSRLSSFPSCVCNSKDRCGVTWTFHGSLSVPVCIQICENSLQFFMYLNLHHRTTCLFADILACHWLLGAFTKLRKAAVSFVVSVFPSVRPHGTNRLPLDGCSWNLIFGYFSQIRFEDLNFIKICQEYWVLHMKTCVRLW